MYASLFGSLLLFTDELAYDFANVIRKLTTNHAFVQKYQKFLKIPVAVDTGTIELNDLQTIQFQNVSFAYDKTKILDNCSFVLEKGKQYAIVGENGSGKTTLIKILLGLLPYEGVILINNIPLEKISKASRKKLFGVIFQDFNCYELSIYDNITLGIKQDITQVLNVVDFDTKVQSLPKQADTLLGKLENGVSLSLGEWQKVAIARVLLRDNQCIVFDEPTASLDPISERNLIMNMQKTIRTDKLSVWITHRLGSCSACDEILVLQNGKIIEQDTFKHLLANDTYFKKLYLTQRSWYDV